MEPTQNDGPGQEIREYVDYLAGCWAKAGVCRGDVLLLHSSITKTIGRARRKGVPIAPMELLRSFLQSVGEEGTLLLPTFDINVSPLVRFDIRNSPSKMGALTECARSYPGAVRTRHPILSMAAIGKKAAAFGECDDYTGIGKGSPFERLLELDGRIAVLGLKENDSMSFYHYVENVNGAAHRWTIGFETEFVDWDGSVSMKKHGFYARRRDEGIVTNVEPMARLLWEKGLYAGEPHTEGAGLRTILAKDVYRETEQIIREGKSEGNLYEQH